MGDAFDAIFVMPRTIYGLSGICYRLFFDMAASTIEKGVLEIVGDPNGRLHGTHVDDCAEAYIALAEHSDVVRG